MRNIHIILVVAVALLSIAAPAKAAEIYDPPRYCNAMALRSDASLRAIAFRNPDLGIAVGTYGAMLRTADGGKSWQEVESTVNYQLDDITWLDDQTVVAVGGVYDPITQISRGAVVFSSDGGRRWWRAADLELPRLRTVKVRQADGALVARGDWSPISLSREFESRDGGRTWQSSGELDGEFQTKPEPNSADLIAWVKATRFPVAIRGYCQIARAEQPQQVWAVGDHGVILHRAKPGDTWKVRRGLRNQTAVLVISSKATTVPWPLLGKEALESRGRVALLTFDSQPPRASDATYSDIDLVRQAACHVGVSSVDNAVSPTEDNNEAASWMAIHRPAVVVIDSTIDQVTRSTITDAAISFGAQRVVKYSFESRGETMIHRNAILPRSGVLASDLWSDALHLVAPQQPLATSISLSRLYDSAGNKIRGDSLTLGVKLNRGQALDAQLEPASRRHLQIAQARINHAKQFQNLVQTSRRADEFAGGLNRLLDQTAKSDQLRLAWSVHQYLANNPSRVADVTGFNEAVLSALQTRFARTSIAWYAELRQQSIQHSAEWHQLKTSLANSIDNSAVETAAVDVVPVSPFQIQQASATTMLTVPDTTPVQATQETLRGNNIDMNWEFHPLALVVRDAARRRGDDEKLQATDGVSANLRRLLQSSDGDWLKLLRAQGPQVINALPTESRPRLDGELNEPCWRSVPNSGGIQCAYDAEFLYLAVTTPVADFGDDTELPPAASVRDQDLTLVDRLQVSLDTDADLLSAANLEVTRGGRTHDSIDRQPAWQPDWYVASKVSGDVVVTEMALLRRDLVDLPIVAGQSWLIRARTFGANEPTLYDFMPRANQWKRIVFH